MKTFSYIKSIFYQPGQRVSWRALTDKEQASIPNTPGYGFFEDIIAKIFNFFGFEFTHFSFAQHDFYYEAGGDLRDKIHADVLMLLYMMVDAMYQNMWWKRVLVFFVVAPLAFIGVSTIGLFPFDFTAYKTKKQILAKFKILYG